MKHLPRQYLIKCLNDNNILRSKRKLFIYTHKHTFKLHWGNELLLDPVCDLSNCVPVEFQSL